MKRGLHDVARPDFPAWEPEPLHLPVPERREDRRGPRNQSDDTRDDDRSGRHVIVIDLA
jgi:hypothetical protein